MNRRAFTSLIWILLIAAPLNGAKAAEDEKKGSTKEVETKETVDGWVPVVGKLFGEIAWPLVVVVAGYAFRRPLENLLTALTLQVGRAETMKVGDLFSFEAKSTEDFVAGSAKAGAPAAVIGDPDLFRLVCKASNKQMAKSTKVMNLTNGCLVQVSTKEVSPNGQISVAEALAFVPGINMDLPPLAEQTTKSKVSFRTVPDA